MGRHDDIEYKVVSKDTEGKEVVQQVFGPPNEKKAEVHVRRSLEASGQSSPDDALAFVRMERVKPKVAAPDVDEDNDNG